MVKSTSTGKELVTEAGQERWMSVLKAATDPATYLFTAQTDTAKEIIVTGTKRTAIVVV